MESDKAWRGEAVIWCGGALVTAALAWLLSPNEVALGNLMMVFWSWLLLTPPLRGAWCRLRPVACRVR